MKVVVLQSNYIPWRGYFDLINTADIFCFYDEVKYTKNDWRNRNQIYTKNGLAWLSIPISKDAVKAKISDVELIDNRWQKRHFKTIYQTYNKAPFFAKILPLLEDVYMQKSWVNLSELNQYFIKLICEYIQIETPLVDSKEYNLSEGRIERLANLIQQLKGTEYISGPSGHNYLKGNESLFKEKGIELHYKSYKGYPHYLQNKIPFKNQVSIIDLLSFVPRNQLLEYISI